MDNSERKELEATMKQIEDEYYKEDNAKWDSAAIAENHKIDYKIVERNYKCLKLTIIFFFSTIVILFILPFVFNFGSGYLDIFDVLLRIICMVTVTATVNFMFRIFKQTNEMGAIILILILILSYFIAIIYALIRCHNVLKQRNDVQKAEI